MDIERQSEATLKIQREEEMDSSSKERWVEFGGSPRARRDALKLLMKIASVVKDEKGKVLKEGSFGPLNRDDGLVLLIRHDEVGRLMGRGGDNIRRIEEFSNARVDVDRHEARVTIIGKGGSLTKARSMVLSEVSYAKTDDGTILKDDGKGDEKRKEKEPLKLWVWSKEAGRIIGRGGETVREINQKTGADVQVSRQDIHEHGIAERLIQVMGTKAQIEEAYPLVVKDVTFVRSELGVIKHPNMPAHQAEENVRRGPGAIPGAFPPPFPGMPGMPPPGMWPPPGMLPPGMMPPMMPGMPPPAMPGYGPLHPPGSGGSPNGRARDRSPIGAPSKSGERSRRSRSRSRSPRGAPPHPGIPPPLWMPWGPPPSLPTVAATFSTAELAAEIDFDDL